MISDSDLVRFTIVDTPSYISLSLLHKSTGSSQNKISGWLTSYYVSSFNLSTSMASSTEISSDSIFQAEGNTKRFIRGHWKLLYYKILPVLELIKNGHYQMLGENLEIRRDQSLYLHISINLNRFMCFQKHHNRSRMKTNY